MGILTQNARVEIVDSLSTLVMVHTIRPTPEDLTVLSRRLIEKHPSLHDRVDNGFVSSYSHFFKHKQCFLLLEFLETTDPYKV